MNITLLHAQRLPFMYPVTAEKVEIMAPVRSEFAWMLGMLFGDV
jgi:hypothetical protein